jgi:phage terminase Nu1 subunit (DNA packaging protein)
MSDAFLDNVGLAKLFGVTTRTITDLCRRRVIVRRGKRFDRDEATLGYVRYLREAAAGRGQASGGAQAVSERARLAAAQADSWELKNKIARRELVSEAEIEETWTEIVLRTRTAILQQPARLSAELPHLSRYDVATITRSLRDALAELGRSP